MDETMSHVSLSVEKREDEIYIPPKQSANTVFGKIEIEQKGSRM